jgi:hypothetical protein
VFESPFRGEDGHRFIVEAVFPRDEDVAGEGAVDGCRSGEGDTELELSSGLR